MPKKYLLTALLGAGLLATARPAAAQLAPPSRVCFTQQASDFQQAELKRRDPSYDPNRLSSRAPQLTTSGRTTAVTYTLPVVVHVIHNGEAVGSGTNLSRAQVQAQIDVLNEDYRNLNADGVLVPAVYQPRRGDVQVQFVLARVDPAGNVLAEQGIDRVDRNAKGFTAPPYGGTTSPSVTYIESVIKPQTSWDPTRYVNIWVMDLNGGGLLGYAQFPDNNAGLGGLNALGGLAATDGVVVKHSAFGSRPKNPTGTYINRFDRGRTLTHELGHWLGLRHIWGDANCGNDFCPDTPTQQAPSSGCPAFPIVTCSNGTGNMSMNYMDYSDDACTYMFSGGQVDRMQAVMAANTPRRTSLATSNVGCPSVLAATAANSGPTCPGGSVTLTATGPAGAAFAWTGPNGFTASQATVTLTNISPAQAGVYSVTTTLAGSTACPGSASTRVVVNAAPPVPVFGAAPFSVCPGTSTTLAPTNYSPQPLPSENFNGTAPGWTLTNVAPAAANTAWRLQTAPYNYTSAFITLSNYSLDGSQFALANSDAGGNGSTTNTTLTSPAFSTQGYSTLQLRFQQYLRLIGGDLANVEASTDNGTTWQPVVSYTATQGSPTAPATTTVNLDAFVNRPSLRLRWNYQSAWGYLWAVDNVALTGTALTPTFSWSLVSGDGLPATTNTASLTVAPTQSSVYRLTVSLPGVSCTTSATVSVQVSPPVWSGAAGNGNWSDARNWQGCVPTRTSDALIPAGLSTPYPTLTTGTAEVRTLTQRGTLSQTGGELALYGDLLNSGTLNLTGGTVATRGAGAQALPGTAYQTLAIGGSGSKTMGGAASVAQALTMAGGNLTLTAPLTLASTAALLGETDASYVTGQVQTTRTLSAGTPESFGYLGLTIAAPFAPGATTVVRTTGQVAAGTVSRSFAVQAAQPRGLQGARLTFSYLPREVNGLVENELVFTRRADPAGAADFTVEGASQRDLSARQVTRNYVTNLNGLWTLRTAASAQSTAAATGFGISAFPVPFASEGLSLQVSTNQAGPLTVRLYDVLGRVLLDRPVVNVEAGTSTINLTGTERLSGGRYLLRVEQNGREVRLNVVRE